MKKLISLTLALVLALAAFIVPAAAEENTFAAKTGMLTILNLSEAEAADLMESNTLSMRELLERGVIKSELYSMGSSIDHRYEVTYYDTLDTMLMALNTGTINNACLNLSVARYLCARNDNLLQVFEINETADQDDDVAVQIFKNRVTSDFSFMMLDKNTMLRDEFSDAIRSLREDGTLARLEEEQINGAVNGSEIAPVQMPVLEGAPTIRVAVTGSLPPMDYISADGTPAGFSTALLAEISTRIAKNIELVPTDSLGRATALSTGVVDVVFWTRTNTEGDRVSRLTEEERQAEQATMSEAELAVLRQLGAMMDIQQIAKMDMPDGTIVTDPYYSDIYVPIVTKTFVDSYSK